MIRFFSFECIHFFTLSRLKKSQLYLNVRCVYFLHVLSSSFHDFHLNSSLSLLLDPSLYCRSVILKKASKNTGSDIIESSHAYFFFFSSLEISVLLDPAPVRAAFSSSWPSSNVCFQSATM